MKPIIIINLALGIFWLIFFRYCQTHSFHDPSTPFYDETRAYTQSYSAVRETEAEEFLSKVATTPATAAKPWIYPGGNEESKNKKELEGVRVCIGIPSIRRERENFVGKTIASLVDTLSFEERKRVDLKILLGEIDPKTHPAYGQAWLSNIADEVLIYGEEGPANEAGYHFITDASARWSPEDARNKRVQTDYANLMEACRNQGADYFILIEDDVIASRDWFKRLTRSAEEVEARTSGDDWLYLRLFYTETYLGWNSEDWLVYVGNSLFLFIVVTGSVLYWRWRSTAMKSLKATDLIKANMDLIAIIAFWMAAYIGLYAKPHLMALVRERRQLNLRLPLPESAERRPRFPLPLPPSALTTTTTTTTAAAQEADRLADLERLQVLGHGNGGTVYKVRHKRTSAVYALKVVHGDCDTTTRRQIFREMEILRRTDSPFVVRCHGIFEKPGGDIAIVMEYMDSGTLDTLLRADGTFSEISLAHIARQVLNGLNYLHSHKIVHRDIKPSNLLVNQKMEVKIADFGVSKIMCRTLDPCNSYVGTCAYMSPERFDPDTYGANYNGYAGDIWSLGLTLFELYVGHFPFLPPGQRPDWATLMCAICFGEPPSLPEKASKEFKSFIQCCLQKDSSKRWTVSQLLSHPFLCKDRRSGE